MATSNITNTILDPSSDPVEGVKVVATLMPGPGFREDTLSEVARSVSTESDVNGAWTLALERNSNITPDGTYYAIDEFIPKAKGGPTRYIIQVGASNQTVSAAMVNPNPTLETATYLTQAAGDARYLQGSLSSDTPDAITADQAGAAGSSGNAARADHAHALTAATPVALGTSLSEGSSDNLARADHVHTPLARMGWHLRRAATQTLSAATETDISWDTEVQDTPGNFTAPGTTLTIPTGGDGLWLISVFGNVHAPSNGVFYLQLTAGGIAVRTDDSDDIEAGENLVLTMMLPLVATNTIVVDAFTTDSRNFTGRITAYRIGI